MNAKQNADGSLNILYLESKLNEELEIECRVILPITDPYVRHHGALGSFAVVYFPNEQPGRCVRKWLLETDGVTEVYDRRSAVEKLELPCDRIGDLMVLGGRNLAIGRTPRDHDLSSLDGGLRSHGGRYEEMVPLIVSEPLKPEYQLKAESDPRNFDIFDFTINGVYS